VRTFDSYPHLLHRAIKQRFAYAVTNVIVTAKGGEDSFNGANRFAHDVLPLRADVVTIDYSLNDRKIGLKVAETSWRQMIEATLHTGSRVLLLTPSGDLECEFGNRSDPIHQHAEQVRSLAIRYNVGLVDSTRLFLAYVENGGVLRDLMSDTRHPNRTGHAMIAGAIFDQFSENHKSNKITRAQ
jgi:lysophospholipase L1-like esterase